MSFKKLGTSLFISAITLMIPLSSVFADAAGWQFVTQQTVQYNGTLDRYITGVDDAHISGNVLVCVRGSGSTKVPFYVKEYDPGTNKDEMITFGYLPPTSSKNSTDCLQYDITDFQDGTNNQAEIYVQTTTKSAVFTIYD